MRDDLVRVLIADDHPVGRLTVELALRHHGETDIVGVATSGSELVHRLEFIRCDVVVTDYAMPDVRRGDGLAMLARIRRQFPDVRVVVLTAMHDPGVVGAILDEGIDCIVSKVDGSCHVRDAVRAAHERRGYLSPLMASAVLGRYV